MGGSELGDFLRARRGQLLPRQVGLPTTGRRRTPGLRREEVASIAGVSIDYLIRLEQGRETNPSIGVLSALADTLMLSEAEQLHLHTLAALGYGATPCAMNEPPPDRVAPTIDALLDRIDAPACVVGPFGDLLGWNAVWERLASPLGVLQPRYRHNLVRFSFLDPAMPDAVADWSSLADGHIARLRATFPRWGGHQPFAQLVEELRSTAEFARRWDAYPVVENLRGSRLVRHPLGLLATTYEALATADDGQRLICWQAADARTAAVFADLAHDRRAG
jgi:transcriptional regulator with XRE-family HTH domain